MNEEKKTKLPESKIEYTLPELLEILKRTVDAMVANQEAMLKVMKASVGIKKELDGVNNYIERHGRGGGKK